MTDTEINGLDREARNKSTCFYQSWSMVKGMIFLIMNIHVAKGGSWSYLTLSTQIVSKLIKHLHVRTKVEGLRAERNDFMGLGVLDTTGKPQIPEKQTSWTALKIRTLPINRH